MKQPNRMTITKMTELPNIGPAIARDLESIGVTHPTQLIAHSPLHLYRQLCEQKGTHVDPCVLDVFMSAVAFMDGDDAKPWWTFTAKRKLIL